MTKEFILKSLAKVNNSEIVVIDNSEQLVPVKPICEAIGVSFEPQFTKLKNHPIYSSTVTLSITVGADGKDREMICIPFKFLSGWLFSIDARNVNAEVAPTIIKFQMECYEVLHYHFFLKPLEEKSFLQYKNKMMEEGYEEMQRGKSLKTEGTAIEKSGKEIFLRGKNLTIEEYKAEKSQLTIPFKNEIIQDVQPIAEEIQ